MAKYEFSKYFSNAFQNELSRRQQEEELNKRLGFQNRQLSLMDAYRQSQLKQDQNRLDELIRHNKKMEEGRDNPNDPIRGVYQSGYWIDDGQGGLRWVKNPNYVENPTNPSNNNDNGGVNDVSSFVTRYSTNKDGVDTSKRIPKYAQDVLEEMGVSYNARAFYDKYFNGDALRVPQATFGKMLADGVKRGEITEAEADQLAVFGDRHRDKIIRLWGTKADMGSSKIPKDE